MSQAAAAAAASPMKHAGHVQVGVWGWGFGVYGSGFGDHAEAHMQSHLDALVEKAVPYTTLPYASQPSATVIQLPWCVARQLCCCTEKL